MIASVATAVGGVVIGYFTRRSAKDTTDATKEASAITGFNELTQRLQTQLGKQEARISTLETSETTRRRLAREHEKWDQHIVDRFRDLTDEPFPDPPPLDY